MLIELTYSPNHSPPPVKSNTTCIDSPNIHRDLAETMKEKLSVQALSEGPHPSRPHEPIDANQLPILSLFDHRNMKIARVKIESTEIT
jgi:hypothetical protein